MPAADRPLVLASQSPRRVELMLEAGYEFEMLPLEVEETHDAALAPEQLTTENARRKALAVAVRRPDAIVIGADTLVYLDGQPLGKPLDLDHARAMLRMLSGKAHRVCTGVALAWEGGAGIKTFAVTSEVIFKRLDDTIIREYYRKVSPLDKAGAYAVQEHGGDIIHHTEGSWSNIVGLPMERLAEELRLLGKAPLLSHGSQE